MTQTTVTFEVAGATVDNLHDEAHAQLERLLGYELPRERCLYDLDIVPLVRTVGGQVAAWEGVVRARIDGLGDVRPLSAVDPSSVIRWGEP